MTQDLTSSKEAVLENYGRMWEDDEEMQKINLAALLPLLKYIPDDYLNADTEYGWYLCLDGDRIVAGLGVIENDFHDRKDLKPNVCAVWTDEGYRNMGIAGRLLNLVVEDMRSKGITPLYLVTDHVGFYERYGWEFLCMAQGDGEPEMTRVYTHE